MAISPEYRRFFNKAAEIISDAFANFLEGDSLAKVWSEMNRDLNKAAQVMTFGEELEPQIKRLGESIRIWEIESEFRKELYEIEAREYAAFMAGGPLPRTPSEIACDDRPYQPESVNSHDQSYEHGR